MKKFIMLFLFVALVLSGVACADQDSTLEQDEIYVGSNFSESPTLILNGTELNVYTSHYQLTEEHAFIPLSAFLKSIGAEYADSPLNEYGTQCYSLAGKRYVLIPDMHLFILENDYNKLLEKLDTEGKVLSKDTVKNQGLLPKNESKYSEIENGTVTDMDQIWIDHVSLTNALKESGININIEYEYTTRTITVTMPKNN